jgi:DNA mismatch repair ATPase MutS
VIERAKEILASLETSRDARDIFQTGRQGAAEAPAQMPLFSVSDNRLREQLSHIDVTTMTPVEAMNTLHRLTEEVKK